MLIDFCDPTKWNNGYNTVLTGEAGSGKSWTVEHEIIDKYGDTCKIALTGMTGLASCNIKGQTIHSWLNLGCIRENDRYEDKGLKQNLDRIMYNPNAKWEHIKDVDTLIIDEISMCDALTFDIINEILQWVRKNTKPFGGIQVILVGDNYQLPPVKADTLGYYFQSDAYKYGNFKAVVLKEQHRQKSGHFLDVLNRIRVGECTQEDIDFLNTRSLDNLKKYELPDDTVILYPTNREVDYANEQYFESINEPVRQYNAQDTRLIPQVRIKGKVFDDKLDKDLRVPKYLRLKYDCSVLLLANLDVSKGIVNGSKGFFKGEFCDKLLCKINGEVVEVPKQEFEVWRQDAHVFTRKQYPITLGHSVTIHKSQGMTLDKAFIDFTRVRTSHQAYVALSRVKSLEGLYIRGLTLDKVKVDKNVVEYMRSLE